MRQTTKEERHSAAGFLKTRRENLGITQREVARMIGLEYISMVSQIEAGKAKVPPGRYADYARALRMDPKDFVRELLKHYDPEAWKILFGSTEPRRNHASDG